MTFKEWWDKEGLHFSNYETIEDVALRAWNASQNNIKQSVRIIHYDYMLKDWIVRDLKGKLQQDGFTTKDEAKEWITECGYSLLE